MSKKRVDNKEQDFENNFNNFNISKKIFIKIPTVNKNYIIMRLLKLVVTVLIFITLIVIGGNNIISIIKNNVSVIISVFALILSLFTYISNEKRASYQESTNFNVVQNLWYDSPEYILYNESTKKLSDIPSPTYIMFIPTKIKGIFDKRMSHMFLQPVSYTYVKEQIKSGKTTEEIVKSKLPYYFKGKYGFRYIEISMIKNPFHKKGDDVPEKIEVTTYPYLMIAVQIDYKYIGESGYRTQYFVTTPGAKYDIDKYEYSNIIKYFNENAHMEIMLEDIKKFQDGIEKENIYKTAHCKSISILKNTKTKSGQDRFIKSIGGTQGGYGGILKKLNNMATGIDIVGEYNQKTRGNNYPY